MTTYATPEILADVDTIEDLLRPLPITRPLDLRADLGADRTALAVLVESDVSLGLEPGASLEVRSCTAGAAGCVETVGTSTAALHLGASRLGVPVAEADEILWSAVRTPGLDVEALVRDLRARVTSAEAATEQHRAEVEQHRAAREDLADSLTLARRRHAEDVSTIGEALLSEAESRGWCSDFDEIVDGLNGRLSVELPTRTREYVVSVPVTFYVSVPVTARSEEDAQDEADDRWREWTADLSGRDLLDGASTDWSDRRSWSVEEN